MFGLRITSNHFVKLRFSGVFCYFPGNSSPHSQSWCQINVSVHFSNATAKRKKNKQKTLSQLLLLVSFSFSSPLGVLFCWFIMCPASLWTENKHGFSFVTSLCGNNGLPTYPPERSKERNKRTKNWIEFKRIIHSCLVHLLFFKLFPPNS